MKTLKNGNLILVALICFSLVGCVGSKKSTRNGNDSSTTSGLNGPGGFPPPGTGTGTNTSTGQTSGTGNEDGVADAGQTIEYYKLNDPPLVMHGYNNGVVAWSSSTDLTLGLTQNIFFTDQRFNVRVIPRRTFFGTDSKGVSCMFQPRPYERLQVGVRVRKASLPTGDYYLFDDVPVDQASLIHEFTTPANTTEPLVVEVLNVAWDWSCTDYANQGFPNVAGVCPWDKVWATECVQVEVQFSTDFTKDIPGQRTN
jgi:hypothetical protein